MSTSPAVSVVLSVRNGGSDLPKALETILNQSFRDFELIAINNGSTDGTHEFLDQITDSRVRVYHQEDAGLAAALNRGISLARGRYIARQDHDDWALPNRIEQQVAQRTAIAIGERQHDHFIGRAGAGEEMPRIERGILGHDRIEPLRQRRAGLGDALPAFRGFDRLGRRRRGRLVDHRPRDRHDVVVLAALHDVGSRTIIRRPLASRALSENAAQAQEDKYGQRQENDGVDIHVDFAFWSLPATGRPSKRSRSGTAEITSPIESAACRHETMLGQWRFLARASVARFGAGGKPVPFRKSRIFNNLGSR